MAGGIDETFFDIDTDVGRAREPRLFERPARVVMTAHPFSEDDLLAFEASGEHQGLD